ncbi:MAG: hypothetical protein JNL58_27225 [Planctomyces sp.]|nr:hypothetical protein [Planctomyces sp.]
MNQSLVPAPSRIFMHPRTTKTLSKLEKANWFASVGVNDATTAIMVSSWSEAIEYCSSVEWENLAIEAANHYRARLVQRSMERFSQWNDIVDQLKPTTESLVRRKIESVVREHSLPKVFEDTVQWDILHVCMEAEYADIYPPGYYASQAYWYVNGHFPCGWDGEFPEGRIVIY